MLGQPTETAGAGEAAAWRASAKDLAAWFRAHVVVRTDVWGGYIRPDRRPVKTRADGTTYLMKSYTAPAKDRRGAVALGLGHLANHFAGWCPGMVIGLHTTAPDLTSRSGVIEVDKHGDDGDADLNWRAAEHWYRLLTLLGFNVWLSDSNGQGGYHVRIVLDRPVPTDRLYRLLRFVVADHGDLGLETAPETFPKQPALTGLGYGNWLRLPGRHHTLNHWTRFWSGSRWLAGAEAVNVILSSRPDPADLLPDLPPDPPTETPVPAPRPRPTPREGSRLMTNPEIALSCIRAIPNDGLHFDEWLGVGMALASVEHSAAMMDEWVAWSRRSGKHTDGECERRWPTFGGGAGDRRWTIGTLIHLSRRAGHDPFPKAREKPAHARRPTAGPSPRPLSVLPALVGVVEFLPNKVPTPAKRAGGRAAW